VSVLASVEVESGVALVGVGGEGEIGVELDDGDGEAHGVEL
jgi:hypothetical protein